MSAGRNARMLLPAGLALLVLAGASAGGVSPEPRPLALVALVQEEDEGPTERELVGQHIRLVRDTRRDLNDKLEALEELLQLGFEGPRQAALEIDRILGKLAKDYDKERAKVLRDVSKGARRVLAERLDRSATAEVERMRKEWLAASRSASLTKDQVKKTCDPALARMRELLRVTRSDLAELEPELEQRLTALEISASDAALWVDYFVRAREALVAQGGRAERLARKLDLVWDASAEEEGLAAEVTFLLWLAAPMTDADRRTLTKNRVLASEVLPGEAEGNRLLNDIRLLAGLNALRTDPKLCAAGRDHSKDMHELKFFSHTSPVEGKQSFTQRAANFGTSAHAENIAAGQLEARGAIQAWWYSPGHHRGMMGGHGRVGLGRFERHWTQMFGG